MLNTKPYGLVSELTKQISAKDTELVLPVGDGVKFAVPNSDHFYVTVRNGGQREYMKVTTVAGNKLHVERGVDDTTPVSFPKGACVKVEWNPSQLCEFVQNCTGKDSHKINPQVVCLTCDTCLEVDEGGHIINVNGGEKC